jgi:cytochrome b
MPEHRAAGKARHTSRHEGRTLLGAMLRLRQLHAAAATLTLLAYISGEWGRVHAWLGYTLGAVILLRLAWATAGVRQLGLMRFYPMFAGLRLGTALTHPAISRMLLCGIAATLIGSVATGVYIDRGRAIGLATARPVTALANPSQNASQGTNLVTDQNVSRGNDDGRRHGRTRQSSEERIMSEIHETAANTLLLLVALHAAYVSVFKWPLSRFMLFLDNGCDRPAGGEARN